MSLTRSIKINRQFFSAFVIGLPAIPFAQKACDARKALNCDGCVITGTFSGRSQSQNGSASMIGYTFHENNYISGPEQAGGPDVSFGAYKSNCDEVFMTVRYTTTKTNYTLKRKNSGWWFTYPGYIY